MSNTQLKPLVSFAGSCADDHDIVSATYWLLLTHVPLAIALLLANPTYAIEVSTEGLIYVLLALVVVSMSRMGKVV